MDGGGLVNEIRKARGRRDFSGKHEFSCGRVQFEMPVVWRGGVHGAIQGVGLAFGRQVLAADNGFRIHSFISNSENKGSGSPRPTRALE